MHSWRTSDGFRPSAAPRRDSSASADSLPPSSVSAAGSTASTAPTLSRKLLSSLAAIRAAPEAQPAAAHKDPLSLVITTKNFRAFVQKAGPLFWFQDHVEATLLWDDWAWTVMWMALWAAIALRPLLLLAAPPAVLSIILYKTHRARFPNAYPHAGGWHQSPPADALSALLQSAPMSDDHPRPPLTPTPAVEGSMQFMQNLRDIQNMMKMIPEGYDAGSLLVPYLNWSDTTTSMLLLRVSVASTLLMLVVGHLLPLRLLLLVGGEGVLLANHPWIKPFVQGLTASAQSKDDDPTTLATMRKTHAAQQVLRKKRSEAAHVARTWIELDQLPDLAWTHGWRDVELYENERFVSRTPAAETGAGEAHGRPRSTASTDATAQWSGEYLHSDDRRAWTRSQDGWSPPGLASSTAASDGVSAWHVAAALPRGWVWLDGDDWRVDDAGTWSPVGTDAHGWVYTDTDWRWPAPYAYGHPGQPTEALHPDEAQATLALVDSHEGEDNDNTKNNSTPWNQSLPRVDGTDLPLAALDRHGAALTRRRRWLRRCIRIAASE